MRLTIAALICTAALLGCATPPGQIPESDFVWETKTLSIDYQDVYKNIRATYRHCGGKFGVPEGDVYPVERKAKVDLYTAAVYGGRSDFVLGVIDVTGTAPGASTVKVGILKRFDDSIAFNKGELRQNWQDFINGKYTACPAA